MKWDWSVGNSFLQQSLTKSVVFHLQPTLCGEKNCQRILKESTAKKLLIEKRFLAFIIKTNERKMYASVFGIFFPKKAITRQTWKTKDKAEKY